MIEKNKDHRYGCNAWDEKIKKKCLAKNLVKILFFFYSFPLVFHLFNVLLLMESNRLSKKPLIVGMIIVVASFLFLS